MNKNMGTKSFKQIYDGLDSASPQAHFVKRIAEATLRTELTVKMWLTGRQTPDPLTQSVIAKELGVPAQGLFPEVEQH